MAEYPIDIVVPWVDGSDPAWRAERSNFRPAANSDSDESRYREWGLFQFWFRSIEQYAPWVRKIHLITWGHLPPWLNTNHPKLNIVNHKDYIPEEYLPTFSSHPIELNIHRIPDLAEHFIYFNDDVYLNNPTTPESFFVGGMPRDTAVLGITATVDNFSYMPYIALNMLGCINMKFSKYRVIAKKPFKWFHPSYGLNLLQNLYFLPRNFFPGFKNFHSCLAYRKSTLEEVWEEFPADLERSCKNRFRSREDVNQYLFRWWRLAKNEFVPSKPNCRYLTIGHDTMDKFESALEYSDCKVVCINDDPSSCDFEEEQKKIYALLQKKFPDPSAFEIPNEV